MTESIDHDRHGVSGTAAMAVAAAQVDMIAAAVAQAGAAATPRRCRAASAGNAPPGPNPEPTACARKFSGKDAHRPIAGGTRRNLLQEAPQDFVQAILDVHGY